MANVDAFALLGLSEKQSEEAARNKQLAANVRTVTQTAVDLCGKPNGNQFAAPAGTLLYQLASRMKAQSAHHVPTIVKYICEGKLTKDAQLSAALDFALHHANDKQLDVHAFEQACGVGVEVTTEQIEAAVTATMKTFANELAVQRYSINLTKLMNDVMRQQPWADRGKVKKETELQLMLKLGPKTAEELSGNVKAKPNVKVAEPERKKESSSSNIAQNAAQTNGNTVASGVPPNDSDDGAETIDELMKTKVHFHKVGENYKTEGYVTTPNTPRLLKNHLIQTGGKVVTRFPPEPNGILHIGHAKAININFGYAKAMQGECNLRYDDTNPEKEEGRFFDAIRDMVEWLGYRPARITYASDNFEQLYTWALELIDKGLAYVCHQRQEELKGFNPPPSPWRDRPREESKALFQDMRAGRFEEGEVTLRMKVTLEDGKQDPVAYRIKYAPHHRTGDTWCIYPTYDYTHCLCDSIENITHSLCTKEFQARRSSYYWLCNALDIYCPVQWEYGRLNVHYAVVSKRKIDKLIKSGLVRDWDDPRLFTLTALRRRGVPPEAINTFVARMGVTMAQAVVDPAYLDAVVRDRLNVTARRCMAVLRPVRVRITNFNECGLPNSVAQPDFPSEPERGSHAVPFAATLYIDADDFRLTEEAPKGFKRLTPAQPVGLVNASVVIAVEQVIKAPDGTVSELVVRAEQLSATNKPKGFVQWVCDGVECEVRLYERLFRHKNPEDATEVPGGFLTDIIEDSLCVLRGALVDRSVEHARVYDKFQFQRIGYFSVDPDSTAAGMLVFNRTVSLKEDAGKSGA